MHILNGKKFLIIGNSHTYYGRTVTPKKITDLTQESRSNDHGYLYEMCRRHGADVSVTNWTFGSHSLRDYVGDPCAAGRPCEGENHLGYLTDRNFDYVVVQANGNDTGEIIEVNAKKLLDIFRAANPNVQMFYLVHHRFYMIDNKSAIAATKNVEKMGYTVVDWGNLVHDVYNGFVKVEGAALEHNKNSYVISKSPKDGFHPSLLSGYITCQMLYCALTGESAVGQDYSFCGDASIHEQYDFDAFIGKYYTYENATTNFKEIFASQADMLGLQKLMDKYLSEKPYRNL